MARNRFVHPDVIRLPLSDGDYLDVKARLNAGETRRVFTRQIKTMHLGEKAELDPALVGLSRAFEYILGWSFVDADGRPVPFSEAAIANLEPADLAEVLEAIEKHDDAIEAAREQEKNGQAGASISPAA